MKKIIPAIIIAFVSGFMFFLYEPIMMYATNINDFWFDFYAMCKPTLAIFCIYFIAILIGYLLVYFINKAFSKRLFVYEEFVAIGFAFLIAFYIQGNYLIKGLPPLDGTKIVWSAYKIEIIISTIAFLLSNLITLIILWKLDFEKFLKIFSFLGVAIFIMLLSSLTITIFSNDTFIRKEKKLTATYKNINTTSNNKNFYILLLDAVDSKTFADALQESEYTDILKDFTYYPDTLSAYPFTRESIPFMLSGEWYENDKSFDDYTNEALDRSKLFDKLVQEKYLINLYEDDLHWNTDKALKVDNLYNNVEMNNLAYTKDIIKYVGFKYLPYQLKKYSKAETLNFNNCKEIGEIRNFYCGNRGFYNDVMGEETLEKIDENYFGFIHLEGAHVPFNLDKDLNEIEDGTYEQKVEANVIIVNKFINRLKANDAYDNSVIMILADHGFSSKSYLERNNPILYIKGIDEHHDEMEVSNLPISFEDLMGAYTQLLDGSKTGELFQNIDPNRKRRLLFYIYLEEDHKVEYEQTGTADNSETLIPTGREYNR